MLADSILYVAIQFPDKANVNNNNYYDVNRLEVGSVDPGKKIQAQIQPRFELWTTWLLVRHSYLLANVNVFLVNVQTFADFLQHQAKNGRITLVDFGQSDQTID